MSRFLLADNLYFSKTCKVACADVRTATACHQAAIGRSADPGVHLKDDVDRRVFLSLYPANRSTDR